MLFSDIVPDEPEAVVVEAAVEFPAAGVAGDGAADGTDAGDHRKAGGTGVGVVAFEAARLERKGVVGLLVGDAEFRAGGAPLRSVRIDVPPPATLVGEQVGELMFQRAPDIGLGEILELWIHLDPAGGPPSAAGRGAHPGVPGHADFPCQLGQAEGNRLLLAPRGHAGVMERVRRGADGLWRGSPRRPQPCGESEFQLREGFWHPARKARCSPVRLASPRAGFFMLPPFGLQARRARLVFRRDDFSEMAIFRGIGGGFPAHGAERGSRRRAPARTRRAGRRRPRRGARIP